MSPVPSFYDPQRIGALFYPDMARIADEAAAAGLPPASEDARNVHLLLIDMQVDFCHETGSLYVPGALGDLRRSIEFIYRNAAHITQITCSLDSHLPSQIFSPNWWGTPRATTLRRSPLSRHRTCRAAAGSRWSSRSGRAPTWPGWSATTRSC